MCYFIIRWVLFFLDGKANHRLSWEPHVSDFRGLFKDIRQLAPIIPEMYMRPKPSVPWPEIWLKRVKEWKEGGIGKEAVSVEYILGILWCILQIYSHWIVTVVLPERRRWSTKTSNGKTNKDIIYIAGFRKTEKYNMLRLTKVRSRLHPQPARQEFRMVTRTPQRADVLRRLLPGNVTWCRGLQPTRSDPEWPPED